ncbi:DMT family transporter [Dysgonomonas sp. 25]|uniref:DMT family transporter n=1 Tax=Dysgonomonas sp. 25 TaxID=2302933 RepID=UPI0013D36DBD|nr:DMT family transporter [Dysgonomonas sp. 25]NDV69656.1 DMT family transporter [Dysgonomonas sp. 25]
MKTLKGIIFALVSSGTFGLIPLFSIPLMEKGLEGPSILFFRFLFSAIMMAGICLIRKESLKIPSRHLLSIFALSALYAATALFLIYSYHYIPSGMATTIHFMYPIAVSIFMVAFFKERKSISLLLAAIIAVCGVVFLCWTGGGNIRLLGILIAGITILTYSIYIVGVNQSKAGKLPAEVLTFYILLFGALIFLVYALLSGGVQPIPSFSAFTELSLLALLCTVISDLTLVLAIKYVGSTTTSILGSMEPVVAVAVGVVYFSEAFSLYSFIGIALIIISVILVVAQKSISKKTA